jgi:hypothetical protein
MLLRRAETSDLAHARTLLEEARTMFSTLGMGGFARRTGTLLEAAI